MINPCISIIVPIYNQQEYLSATIESLLNQDYQHLEIILVNDGSTDGSLNIIQLAAEKDARIIVIDKENGGVSSARNHGLRVATGALIAYLDADDIALSNRFSSVVAIFKEYPDTDILFHDMLFIDEKGQKLSGSYLGNIDFLSAADTFIEKLSPTLYSLSPDFYSFMITKTVAMSTDSIVYKRPTVPCFFDENLYAGEDADLWIKMVFASQSILYLDIPLVSYRQHSESVTKNLAYFYQGVDMYLKKQLLTYRDNLPENKAGLLKKRIHENMENLAYELRKSRQGNKAIALYWQLFKREVNTTYLIDIVKTIFESLPMRKI